MSKEYYVYIMTNHNNSVLYTGMTNDLYKRNFQHKQGESLSSFTKRYRVYKVVYIAAFSSPYEAIKHEKEIKGWRREKKIKLIESDNPKWKDLLSEKSYRHPDDRREEGSSEQRER